MQNFIRFGVISSVPQAANQVYCSAKSGISVQTHPAKGASIWQIKLPAVSADEVSAHRAKPESTSETVRESPDRFYIRLRFIPFIRGGPSGPPFFSPGTLAAPVLATLSLLTAVFAWLGDRCQIIGPPVDIPHVFCNTPVCTPQEAEWPPTSLTFSKAPST